jgi:Methyl-accepting chemotaxis protein (MCP) signalling domain
MISMGMKDDLIKLAPYFHKLISHSQLVITDLEGYIFCLPGDEFFLKVFDKGEKFLEGSIGKQTVTTGQMVARVGNKQLTGGITYQGVGVPLHENGEIVGGICLFFPMDSKEALQNAAEQMVAMVQEVSATIETFHSSSEQLQSAASKLTGNTEELHAVSKNIGQLTTMISDISSRSRLLGLNATIEAVHAGESGRGFTVVANEIRRLSERTADSAKSISTAIEGMIHAVSSMQEEIQHVSTQIHSHSAGANELSGAAVQLTALSEQLSQLSQKIHG